MIDTPCQRWRHKRDSYRPAGEPLRTERYGVELVSEAEAKRFTEAHHYSGTYPAARVRVGLRRVRPGGGSDLVGVAVYSVPMSQAVIPKWTGLEPAHGVELGRLVLLDDVEGNGETWFLARAMALVRQELPDVRAVLSCSDPVRRISSGGRVILPGHVGTVYQALNARHVGRTERATLYVTPGGEVVCKRTLSKIAGDEVGAAYAADQLLEFGAPPRFAGESGQSWIARIKASGWLGRFRHPGNLVYLWPMLSEDVEVERWIAEGLSPQAAARVVAYERQALTASFPPALPYPKARETVVTMEARWAA